MDVARVVTVAELAQAVEVALAALAALRLEADGARAWRRVLTVEGVKPGADEGVILRALDAVTGRDAEAA